MSYRIYLGIVKVDDYNEHIGKDFSNIKDAFELHDAMYDFFYNSREVELHDNLDIKRFLIVNKYKDDEYPPYIVNKIGFQYILDYYKELILNDFNDKEKNLDSTQRNVVWYFKDLIEQNINIKSSGLFLLDYFYLVKLFENIKRDEIALITHG